MKDFIERNKNKVFRYWHRKRMWTPYEMELKDPCQSDLEFEECSYGYLIEAVNLGYDWLIGISEDVNNTDYVQYYRLNELDLALSKSDQED
jgi:hypothetical protein